MMLSEVCLSVWLAVAYIGNNSRTERPRKTKIGTRHMRLGHHFQGQKVKSQLAGAAAYCGGIPHSLLVCVFDSDRQGKNLGFGFSFTSTSEWMSRGGIEIDIESKSR